MIKNWLIFIAISVSPFTLYAQNTPSSDTLLDHMTGKWLLKGVIGGANIEHDVTAGWVLGHQYIQLKETSRERQASGLPTYDAMIFISHNQYKNQYDCLWLDNTSNTGLSNEIIAHAKAELNKIALLFKLNDHSYFHTTLTYEVATDSWHWLMSSDENGKTEVFADAIMSKSP